MKRNVVLKSCIAYCLIASMAQNVYAEEMGGGAEKSKSTHNLDQVVVTATRTEKLLEDVAVKMEVITAEDIENLGSINLEDALRKAANVTTRGNGISIRGMDYKHTLFLINGRRVTPKERPDSSAETALDKININNVERIEIVRGAASAIYGSDAMGGVINIITKKSKERSVRAGVSTSIGERSNYYAFDFGTTGKWDALLDVRYTDLLSYTPTFSSSASSSGDRTFFNLDLGYQIDENNELRLYLDYAKEKTDRIRGSDDSNSEEDTYDAALVYNGSTDNHDYSLTTSYGKIHSTSETFDRSINKIDQGSTQDFEIWGIDFRDSWVINDANLVTFGGEFKSSSSNDFQIRTAKVEDSAGNVVIPTEYYTYTYKSYDNIKDNYYALYVQDEIILFDETLFVTPAARYDYYDAFGGHLTPKLGGTWKFTENQRIKVSYGLGFRAPSVKELYINSWWSRPDNTRFLGNPDLKPEETVSYDITYEAEYKNVSGAITYFNNEIENLIEWSRGPQRPDGTYVYRSHENIAKASVSGVEAQLSLDFLDSFNLTGQYHYIDAMDEIKNTPLSSRAKHTYVATLDYHNDNGFSTSVWSSWVKDMWYSSSKGGIDFNTVNMAISKKWGDKYRFYAGIDNIFDTLDTFNDSYISQREWRAGFEMTF